MHTGKMYTTGRMDAFKECHDLITKLMDERTDCIRRQDSNGDIHEYYPVEVLETCRLSLELLIAACAEDAK